MTDREKLDALKACWRQCCDTFAPKEIHRDVRWTKFINEMFRAIVRVDGTIYSGTTKP